MDSYNKKNLLKIFPFVEVDPFEKACFCVDGRAGKISGQNYGAYPQLLGGSLMPVVLEWLIRPQKYSLKEMMGKVFRKLRDCGYPLGVHSSTYANKQKSDCGFADNLELILATFRENLAKIRDTLNNLGIDCDKKVWVKTKHILEGIDFRLLPKGVVLINQAVKQGAKLQILEGQHQEVAAIVNLRKGWTLDVYNNQNHQAFNLDLWLINNLGRLMNWDLELIMFLSLGLYLSTEMVLVESKGKPRLPILIYPPSSKKTTYNLKI